MLLTWQVGASPRSRSSRRAANSVEDSPLVRLTNAVLLTALKKSARTIIIRDGIVVFAIGDQLETELETGELHAPLVRRLVVMANIPTYRKDEVGIGRIELAIGERHAFFDMSVRGHGQNLRA